MRMFAKHAQTLRSGIAGPRNVSYEEAARIKQACVITNSEPCRNIACQSFGQLIKPNVFLKEFQYNSTILENLEHSCSSLGTTVRV